MIRRLLRRQWRFFVGRCGSYVKAVLRELWNSCVNYIGEPVLPIVATKRPWVSTSTINHPCLGVSTFTKQVWSRITIEISVHESFSTIIKHAWCSHHHEASSTMSCMVINHHDPFILEPLIGSHWSTAQQVAVGSKEKPFQVSRSLGTVQIGNPKYDDGFITKISKLNK